MGPRHQGPRGPGSRQDELCCHGDASPAEAGELVEAWSSQVHVCPPGGYSDTYAALCDFNDTPLRDEVQWVSPHPPTTVTPHG